MDGDTVVSNSLRSNCYFSFTNNIIMVKQKLKKIFAWKKANFSQIILAQTENFSMHFFFHYEFLNVARIYDALGMLIKEKIVSTHVVDENLTIVS